MATLPPGTAPSFQMEDPAAYYQYEHWSRQRLQAYQAQALQACRDYAYAHSPFYQRYHQGLLNRPLHELPTLTKDMVMENFDDLVTDRAIRLADIKEYLATSHGRQLYLDRYRVMGTSGSTGQPGFFLYDRAEIPALLTTFERGFLWTGTNAASKVAIIGSTSPGHMSAQFPVVIRGKMLPTFHLAATDPVEKNVQILNETRPDVVTLYPSTVPILNREKLEGRLTITPSIIACSAEPLTGERRREMAEIWGIEPYNAYSTTEAGVMASECEFHNGMHLFEDMTIVEVVDEKNRPVPRGVAGDKVLLTVLYRRAQPLIRYEMSDVLRCSAIEDCPCGRPFTLIETVQGRKLDVLHFPARAGGDVSVTSDIFNSVLDITPVTGWQIIRETDQLRVLLTGAAETVRDDQVADALRQALSRQDIIIPPIRVQRVDTLTKVASGKIPMIISHVPRDEVAEQNG